MAEQIRMPQLSQTTSSSTIVCWHKSEGEDVSQGELLLEVETDKATLEVESYAAGTVLKLVRSAGDQVESGDVIAVVGEVGEQIDDLMSSEPGGHHVASESALEGPQPLRRTGKVSASPAVRRLAKEHGIDLAEVTGSGPGGRVEKEDVLRRVSGQAIDEDIIEPPRHRKAIAARLAKSFQTIPHIYLTVRVDMSGVRESLDAAAEAPDGRITFTHLILQAAARAMKAEPRMNRIWTEDARIKLLRQCDVGLAVGGNDSLIVVNIPESQTNNLAELSKYTQGAVTRARAGTLLGNDLDECALTISNLGMYGIDQFSAIVDPQQSAVLAIGSVSNEVVARDGDVVVSPIMTVTLSADHRVIDGEIGAKFLQAFRQEIRASVQRRVRG